MDKLSSLLQSNKSAYNPVLPVHLTGKNTYCLDLSASNPELKNLDITDNDVFGLFLDQQNIKHNGRIPVGGYMERRVLYRRSDHFGSGSDRRDIHLGFDIWLDSGTPVSAPLDSIVHSFSNNTNYRDYGPTIILEHKLKGRIFYSLYGHLSLESLTDLKVGKKVPKGAVFATVGSTDSNGSWPPHLHMQLIDDIGDWKGDYPGVASEKELAYYIKNCPDPSIILGLKII